MNGEQHAAAIICIFLISNDSFVAEGLLIVSFSPHVLLLSP